MEANHVIVHHVYDNDTNPIIQYIQIIMQIKDEWKQAAKQNHIKVGLLWRGEDKIHDNPNIAGILRSSVRRKAESMLYNEYQKLFIGKLSRVDNDFDKLEFMQHYGLYTRLLDITSNPLVGLYFACLKHKKSSEQNTKQEDKNSGVIYIFNKFEFNQLNNVLNYNDDEVKLLSSLSLMNIEDKLAILKHINNVIIKLRPKSIEFIKNVKYWDFNTLKRKYHKLNKPNHLDPLVYIFYCLKNMYNSEAVKELYLNVFSSTNYPLNLFHVIDKSLIINPDKNNNRIKAQDGYFIFQSYFTRSFFGKNIDSKDKISKDISGAILDKIYIPPECKSKILKELDKLCGINKAKLFPDYSNVASYLDNHIGDL